MLGNHVKHKIFQQVFENATRSSVFYRNYSNTTQESPKPIKMSYATYEKKNSDNIPVVIVHGLFGSKSNWNTMSKSINEATSRKVYAVDARNHGESPHSVEHTYEHLAEDIRLFLNDTKNSKVVLIGHSMGGRASMVFAIKYPSMVESLIPVDISPYGGSELFLDSWMEMFKDLKNMNLKNYATFSEARSGVEKILLEKDYGRVTAAFLSMNIKELAKGQFSWKFNVDALMKNFHPNVSLFPEKFSSGKFDGRTLFIIGGDSTYVDLNDKDNILKIFPNAEFVVVKGSGHWPHYEKPKEFLEIVVRFLNNHSSKK